MDEQQLEADFIAKRVEAGLLQSVGVEICAGFWRNGKRYGLAVPIGQRGVTETERFPALYLSPDQIKLVITCLIDLLVSREETLAELEIEEYQPELTGREKYTAIRELMKSRGVFEAAQDKLSALDWVTRKRPQLIHN